MVESFCLQHISKDKAEILVNFAVPIKPINIEAAELSKIRNLSVRCANYNISKQIFGIALEEILCLIRKTNVRNLDLGHCYIGNISMPLLLIFLQNHQIDKLDLRYTNCITDNELKMIIEHFDFIRVNDISLPTLSVYVDLTKKINDMFEKRKKKITIKLTLMWIHRYHLIPNFPPRGVILMICSYL